MARLPRYLLLGQPQHVIQQRKQISVAARNQKHLGLHLQHKTGPNKMRMKFDFGPLYSPL